MSLVNDGAEAVIRPLAWLAVAAMLAAVLLSVLARETALSLPWVDKVFLVLLPVLAFLVAPVAYRRAENVALDVLLGWLPARLARAQALLIHVCLFVVFVILLDLTVRKVGFRPYPTEWLLSLIGLDVSGIRPFKVPLRIPTLGLEWRYVYAVMPVSAALLLLANAELILRGALGLARPDDPLAARTAPFDEAEASVQRAE